MIEALVMLLIYVIVIGAIFWVLRWAIGALLPAQFHPPANVVLGVIAVVVVLLLLLKMLRLIGLP